MLTRTSPLVAGLPAVTPSKESADEFDRKLSKFLEELGSAFSSTESATITLKVSEAEATSKLADVLKSGQLPVEVENPQVHFRNDRIQVSGDVNLGGTAVNVAVQAQVKTRDGKPEVVIEKVEAGNIGLPDSVRKQILDSLTSGTGALSLQDLPIDVVGVSVADGQLVIEGKKKGPVSLPSGRWRGYPAGARTLQTG